jgi:hypothetical protein
MVSLVIWIARVRYDIPKFGNAVVADDDFHPHPRAALKSNVLSGCL